MRLTGAIWQALGHRPAHEHAIEFETKVEMQFAAACCWTTNNSGPVRSRTRCGPGSGVASNDLLVEYSSSGAAGAAAVESEACARHLLREDLMNHELVDHD